MAQDFDLDSHRVVSGCDSFYIPNFITHDEEEYLVRKISESPQHKWKTLANRRLQIWGGNISEQGALIPDSLPGFICDYPAIISRLVKTGAFESSPHKAPNHVILNEYLPGQGIMPHEDGPSYHPVVATISLGSHAIFHYYRYKPDDQDDSGTRGKIIDKTPIMSVLLEPRSLIISTGEMYTSHLHGIDEIKEDVVDFPDAPTSPSEQSEMFADPTTSLANPTVGGGLTPTTTAMPVTIANLSLLQDESILQNVKNGKPLRRGTRYSLTCRDVTRVSQLSSFLFRRPGGRRA